MQFIFKILFVFILGSTFGFLLEVVYRSIRLKRMVKPGFLAGCCLPIYGTGAVVLYLLCSIDLSFISNNFLRVFCLIVLATILMTVIEYIAGYISIKYFKNKLWDYSNQWGNIQGIICPLFSLVWGGCCLLFYFLVFPWLGNVANFISNNLLAMFFIGIYYGIFVVDLCYSLHLMSKIRSYAIKIKQLVTLDNIKRAVAEKANKASGKKSSIITFRLYSRILSFLEEIKLPKNTKVELETNSTGETEINIEDTKEKN